jgi:MFS family permease
MTSLPLTVPTPTPTPGSRLRGIPPLPLLTLINFFNYLDRQVVYGMTPHIGAAFHLSNFKLGWLAWANLTVFAVASLISGPIADRIGPRKVIFTGILVWSAATIGSALSTSFPMLLFFRALVGVGEGAYGPSANTLLCADAPPEKRGRAMGIYNVGMALGGTSGLVLGAALAPIVGWRGVFWIAGGPSVLLTLMAAFVAAPDRLVRPQALPARTYLLSPVYVMAVAGGVLATFGASSLIFWTRQLVIEERHLSIFMGSIYMATVGLFCGAGGVIAGGYAGDALSKRARGGHALTIGIAMLVAVPVGVSALLVTWKPLFMILTAGAAFFLSVYNGPSAAVIDELGPPQYGATLQAVSMFTLHVLGNSPAPSVIGRISDQLHVPISLALLAAIAAFGLSGLIFLWVARRQRHMPAFH